MGLIEERRPGSTDHKKAAMLPSGAVATGTRKLFPKTGRLSYSLRTDDFSSGSRSVRTSAIPAADAAEQRLHLPYKHSIRYMQRPSIPSPPQSFSRSSSAALTTTKTEPKLCHSAPVTGVRAPAADSATALALMRREAMMLVRTFRITFRIRRNR